MRHSTDCRPLVLTSRSYYNDVWSFDLEELKWSPLGPKPGQSAPAPRGGCQLALHGDTLFIFGGFSVKKAEPAADAGGCWVSGLGGRGASRQVGRLGSQPC